MSLFDNLNNLNKYEITVPAEDQYLKNVIAFNVEKLELKEQKFISNISVITEEAYVNVSHYSGSKDVTFNIFPDNDNFYMEVIDRGTPFDPLQVNKDPYSKKDMDARIGGLGILLLKRMSLDIDYKFTNNENHLLLYIKRR